MKSENRVLVTGGAGFIGSHLCEKLLSGGAQAASVDNFNAYYDPELKRRNIAHISSLHTGKFQSFDADIRDTEAMRKIVGEYKPSSVIHLAAMAGVRPSIQNPALYVDVNISGTQVLLEACRAAGVKNFIFASSSSVYGNNKKVPFEETDNVDYPISPYAATKKAGELMCHTYSHLYGFKTVCLRFFTVYGPRQRPDLAIRKFTDLLLRGEEIPFYGDGSMQRDYTFVEDIIDGVTKALRWNSERAEGSYEIFNLGESRTVSLSEMVSCLEKATGKKARLKRLPMQAGDVNRTFADITKSKRVLGYDPRTPFESGIEKFIEWVAEQEKINA